jgi:hypothetical protein
MENLLDKEFVQLYDQQVGIAIFEPGRPALYESPNVDRRLGGNTGNPVAERAGLSGRTHGRARDWRGMSSRT